MLQKPDAPKKCVYNILKQKASNEPPLVQKKPQESRRIHILLGATQGKIGVLELFDLPRPERVPVVWKGGEGDANGKRRSQGWWVRESRLRNSQTRDIGGLKRVLRLESQTTEGAYHNNPFKKRKV